MRSTIRDVFPIAEPETFWNEVFFSTEVQESIYRDGLGCPRAEVLTLDGDLATGIHRKFVFEQPVAAPGPLKRLFGQTQEMREEGTYDPATGHYLFRMEPAGPLANKLEIRGDVSIERLDGGQVARICVLDFNVRIMGVGGLAERFIAKSNTDNYARRTDIVRDMIRTRGLK